MAESAASGRPAVSWDRSLNAWVVSSYSGYRAVSRDDGRRWRKTFRPSLPDSQLIELWGGGSPHGITYVPPDGASNAEEHKRLHHWWMRALSRDVVDTMRDAHIRPVVNEALDRLASVTRADLDQELAQRIPMRVVARVLGLPHDDEFLDRCRELLAQANAVRAMSSQESDGSVLGAAAAASAALRELLLPHVLERRAGTGDDFISLLWREAPSIFSDGWDEQAIVANVRVMFQAGARSTANGMANAFYVLLTTPGLPRTLAEGGAAVVADFVEEVLRVWSPVYATLRQATAPTEVEGVPVAAGEVVLLMNQAAGRDGALHAVPDSVDLDSPTIGRHVAFHQGPRACTGQFLARAEIEEIVSAFVTRLPNAALDPTAAAPQHEGEQLHRGWRPLHAVLG